MLIAVACITGGALAIFTDWGRVSVLFAVPVVVLVLLPMWYWAASVRLKPEDTKEEPNQESPPAAGPPADRAAAKSNYCPKCRIEYWEWVKTCRYCGVETVPQLPPGIQPRSQDTDPYPFRQTPPLELRKLGNRKCPNCGRHQGWYRALGPYRWQTYPCQWQCSQCQAVLTYDYNRSFVLKAAAFVPLILGLLLFMGCLEVPLLCIFLPIPIIVAVLVYLSSVNIVRRSQ